MLVYELHNYVYNADDFHSKRDEIYVVQREMDTNGDVELWSDIPQELGVALERDFPQVESMVRVNSRHGIVKRGDKVFHQSIAFVDEGYFDLFDFPVKWGDPTTFIEEGIVLSAPVSEKYFGEKNPIGETITIRFNEEGKELVTNFVVKAVLEKMPTKASYYNDILIPYQRLKIFGKEDRNWTNLANPIFIQVKEEAALASIKEMETSYLDIINKANDQWNMTGIYFQSFTSIMVSSTMVRNAPFNDFMREGIILVSTIGFFLLLMACFNYLNIALASASTRLKEISVRKVMGGSRQQIITQFILEHFIICFVAFGVGILLAFQLFLPWFNNMVGHELLQLSYLSNPTIWLFSLMLLVFIVLLSAGYPAFYISKQQPVAILKKEFRLGGKSGFQKFLIGAQLFLSVLTIYATYSGLALNHEIRNKDWGYNQNSVGVIQLENSEDFLAFKNDLQANKDILEVTGSQHALGRGTETLKAQHAGKEYEVQGITVAANYLSLLEVPLLEGRFFDAQKETDKTTSVMVNESFLRMMDWEQASGQSIKIADLRYQIIGAVKDVHQNDFMKKVQPLVFKMGLSENFNYLSIRTQPGMAVSTIKSINTNWSKFYPNIPYTYFFQDNAFFLYFRIFDQGASILYGAALMTLLICTIGLFGLAMLLLNRKMKEISIRKVLGASKLQIVKLIQRDFFIPLFVALIIALPIGHYAMLSMKMEFAPTVFVGVLPFVFTIGSIFLMVVLSLSKHIYTAIQSDPSQFLRDE